jgi:hypothetical protein
LLPAERDSPTLCIKFRAVVERRTVAIIVDFVARRAFVIVVVVVAPLSSS